MARKPGYSALGLVLLSFSLTLSGPDGSNSEGHVVAMRLPRKWEAGRGKEAAGYQMDAERYSGPVCHLLAVLYRWRLYAAKPTLN